MASLAELACITELTGFDDRVEKFVGESEKWHPEMLLDYSKLSWRLEGKFAKMLSNFLIKELSWDVESIKWISRKHGTGPVSNSLRERMASDRSPVP